MLGEIRQYDNIGTAAYFWELLGLFYDQPNTDWTDGALDAHFKNRVIDGKYIFRGGLRLLVLAGVLEVDIAGVYHLSYSFRQKLHSHDHCRGRVLDALLEALKSDEDVYAIFSPEFCTYDIVNNVMQVNKSAFGLQHANIRDVLVSLGFLVPHPTFPAVSFAVNKPNRRLFDKHLKEGMRKRQLTPEQLKGMQTQQQENGLIGEQFVFDYERTRTGRDDDVEWVAIYDAAAGFDIMSFESNASTEHDRFIEVKAYSGDTPYFYWSRNEMEEAQKRGEEYFLYLVNLDEVNRSGYEPIIIPDPTSRVLADKGWMKTVDKYHITKVA